MSRYPYINDNFGRCIIFWRYVVYINLKHLIETILMITHNIPLFYGWQKYYPHYTSKFGAIAIPCSKPVILFSYYSSFQYYRMCVCRGRNFLIFSNIWHLIVKFLLHFTLTPSSVRSLQWSECSDTLLQGQGHSRRPNVTWMCPLHVSLISTPILKIFHTYKPLRQSEGTLFQGHSGGQRSEYRIFVHSITPGPIPKKFHTNVHLMETMCREKIKDIVWGPRSHTELYLLNSFSGLQYFTNMSTSMRQLEVQRSKTPCFKVIAWGQRSHTQNLCSLHISWTVP